MGQRVQMHLLDKNGNWKSFHHQFGYGFRISEFINAIKCKNQDEYDQKYKIGKYNDLSFEDKPYFYEYGDNNNGYLFVDEKNKKYAILSGYEQRYKVNSKFDIFNFEEYSMLCSGDKEYCLKEYGEKFWEENINHIKNEISDRKSLFTDYKLMNKNEFTEFLWKHTLDNFNFKSFTLNNIQKENLNKEDAFNLFRENIFSNYQNLLQNFVDGFIFETEIGQYFINRIDNELYSKEISDKIEKCCKRQIDFCLLKNQKPAKPKLKVNGEIKKVDKSSNKNNLKENKKCIQ